MRTLFDLSVKFTRVVCELKIYKTKTEILKAIFDFLSGYLLAATSLRRKFKR